MTSRVLKNSRGRGADIVCIATRRIDNPMPTNVQHLMLRLAQRHRILYLEPPVDPVFLARNRKRGRAATPIAIPGALTVVSPVVLPWARRFPLIGKWNRKIVRHLVRRRMKGLLFDRPVLWLFSPRDADLIGAFGESALCYHITDAYKAMPTAGNGKRVETAEDRILEAADCVFVTSAQLAEDRGLSGDKIHVVPNVADVEHFSQAADAATHVPEDIASIASPIAGFFGAIDAYKVDFELLAACARHTPQVSYVLIGPRGWADDTDTPEALNLPNVHFLGPRPFASLPGYLKAFAVSLIPYRLNDYTRYCSPLKLYEYLASGTGVVATNLPAFREAKDFVTIAETPEAFAAAILDHVDDDQKAHRERSEFAAAHSWRQRIREIEAALDAHATC